MARSALLSAMAALTIVLPLSGGVLPGNGTYVAAQVEPAEEDLTALYPSTLEALLAPPTEVSDEADPRLAAEPAAESRALLLSSRADDRGPLPGCDGSTRPAGSNGMLRTADLCLLWDGKNRLRADAAVALAELNQSFRARFQRNLCITDSYRTLAAQRALKATKPGLSAVPGRSNHGWGLAIDLCSSETKGAGWAWLQENAHVYGWVNPAWARAGGRGPYEPWHWEYVG